MIPNVDTVENLKYLEAYENNEAYVESEQKIYVYKNDEWVAKDNTSNELFEMNLYEMNKQIMQQCPACTKEEIEQAKKLLDNYFANTEGKYFMLLCNDLRYYTLFVRKPKLTTEKFSDVVIECLDNVGSIKSIDLVENEQVVEIWVTVKEIDTTFVMYLFNYDEGVIPCV